MIALATLPVGAARLDSHFTDVATKLPDAMLIGPLLHGRSCTHGNAVGSNHLQFLSKSKSNALKSYSGKSTK